MVANKTTIYDVKTKAKIHEFKHDNYVSSVAFSNDDSMLATGDDAYKTTIYDVKTKAKIHEFKHDNYVRSVAFSNDGSMLATGDDGQTKQRYMMSKQKQRYMNLNTMVTYQV